MLLLPHMFLVLLAFWLVLVAVIRCVDTAEASARLKALIGLVVTLIFVAILWHFYGPALPHTTS